VILDMRGYPTNAAFEILGHFVRREITSPLWRVPILGTSGFHKSSWTIRPATPRLDAKVIMLVDGRAISAAETVLQIFHDNAVGSLVGEPSAGTNGNMVFAKLPVGFSVQFTGLRVQLQDGAALQGRGITPDVVVHPTLAGVRAGRDEVLEAALELATRR
jgi:C-terminal processing protease CtpA/Prc